jgi:hypothetical protein
MVKYHSIVYKITVMVAIAVGWKCSFVLAGTQTAQVADISIRTGDVGTSEDSLVIVNLAATPAKTGSPACATFAYWIIRDAKSEVGKQQIALLMTAKAQARPVTIYGTDSCSRWPNGEDIRQVTWSQ